MIKNIVFDLGGVLMDIDFRRTFLAFEVIGFRGAEEAFHDPEIHRLLTDFETGSYCSIELRRKFRELTGLKCNDIQFDKAWNAMLVGFRRERIDRVQEVARRYKTYLLSNTNPIHARWFNAELNRQFGIESMDHLVDKAWYSHLMGFRKPDERIYNKLLKITKIHPDETLFLDDMPINVEVARSLGIQARLITDDFTVLDALESL
jgi:epoxide hydrolase-like predicted phosphatase